MSAEPVADHALGERPLRADARRNRDSVLAAAEELFGQQGSKASIQDVARHAGVGVGTVCRHFPTKEALMEAVIDGLQQSAREYTQATLVDPDPGAALRTLLTNMSNLHWRARVLAEDLSREVNESRDRSLDKDQFRADVNEIVQRAQAAGAIRADVGPTDIGLLLSGVAHASAVTDSIDPDLRLRYLTIMLDGLRPLDATPLPGQAVGLDELEKLRAANSQTATGPC